MVSIKNMMNQNHELSHIDLTRREFMALSLAATAALTTRCSSVSREPVVIMKAENYSSQLKQKILAGLKELNITEKMISGKKILLKPNLVEPHRESKHINTDPLLIEATIESFLALGAASVAVAEGAGHMRDSYLVEEESGLSDVLFAHNCQFIDLNFSPVISVPNRGKKTVLKKLIIPREIINADIIVSMAKMKTHHWAGATLSMKNLFGIMPGSCYGWPKNVLHWNGIEESICDINATIRPQLAIVDGIVGMEGDGPIMGKPVNSKVLVLGTNLPAVDATCARIMGIQPERIGYLKMAENQLGPIKTWRIEQRGEKISDVQKNYHLLDFVPAQRFLRKS